jgi:hypothetical protein
LAPIKKPNNFGRFGGDVKSNEIWAFGAAELDDMAAPERLSHISACLQGKRMSFFGVCGGVESRAHWNCRKDNVSFLKTKKKESD